jgi:peroxiredoxin
LALGAVLFSSLAVTGQGQELSFTGTNGQAVTSASFRGRVVVLMFSGIQDPQCRDEMKALESLAERYQGQSVSVYWVSINSNAEADNERLTRPCGASTPVSVLRLTDINVFKRISGRTASLPTIVLMDKQGQLFGQPRSGFNPNTDFVNDIAELVDSLLARK